MPISEESPSNQTCDSVLLATSSSNPSAGTSSSTPTKATNRQAWEGRGDGTGNVATAAVEEPVVDSSFAQKISIVDALNRHKSMSRDEQISSLPFCLVDKELTLEEFHAQCNALEGVGCSRCEFRDGGAWIYEIPDAAHDRAAGEVIRRLDRQLGNNADDFRIAASPRCDNNDANWSFEPDFSLTNLDFRPGPNHVDAADSSGNRWPNLIVEVAHQETETHLRGKALAWLNTAADPNHGVQQVLAIKIGSTVRGDGHRTMKAWRYERGANENPVQYIEFGNHGPNNGATQPGSPGMQLHVPIKSLYLPLSPPDELGEVLDLDLFYIRKVIEEAL